LNRDGAIDYGEFEALMLVHCELEQAKLQEERRHCAAEKLAMNQSASAVQAGIRGTGSRRRVKAKRGEWEREITADAYNALLGQLALPQFPTQTLDMNERLAQQQERAVELEAEALAAERAEIEVLVREAEMLHSVSQIAKEETEAAAAVAAATAVMASPAERVPARASPKHSKGTGITVPPPPHAPSYVLVAARGLFDAVDVDGDGSVDREELVGLVREMGFEMGVTRREGIGLERETADMLAR